MNYLEISGDDFIQKLRKDWKEIFNQEFSNFGNLFKLYGFLENNELIGGFCLGYNPDYFKEKINKIIIKDLNSKKYQKISYFFIIDKHKGEKKGGSILLEFMKNNGGKYFLTCDNAELRDYYISLGFLLYNTNKEKFILVFEN